MKDLYNRTIDYMRISVTDLCNFRCRYCMPAGGIARSTHSNILRFEEIAEIAAAAADCGIRRLRLTGGEPLVRHGIISLCETLAAIPGIREISMTTNGSLLADCATDLRAAGITRVNISLDTLQPDKFRRITRGGELSHVLAGIDAALNAGLSPVKLNTVLIRGFNDDEIPALFALTMRIPVEVRLIELMPIGCAAQAFPEGSMPASQILAQYPDLEPLPAGDGIAERYHLPNAIGSIGLIRPVSCRFCGSCNRIRLTSTGMLKPCLHSHMEYPLRNLHGDALLRQIQTAIRQKPAKHHLSEAGKSDARRYMHEIGG